MILHIFLTIAFAAAGGALFLILHIPGSLMVGAMMATIVTNLTLHTGALPPKMSVLVQFLLGSYIGAMIHREDGARLKMLWKPAAVLVSVMTVYAVTAGALLHRVIGGDTMTALYSTAPGGMVEVCLFAADTGSNVSYIAGFHTIRTMILYLATPVIAVICLRRERKKTGGSTAAPPSRFAGLDTATKTRYTLMTLAAAAAGGFVGRISGIPAGTLLGSIIGSGIFSILSGHAYIPVWFKRISQILSGAVVGLRCEAEELMQISGTLPIVLLIILGYLILTVALGNYFAKKRYTDLPTGIFSSCAGGVSDVTLVASDYDVDITTVVLLMLIRYFSIFVTYPILTMIFT